MNQDISGILPLLEVQGVAIKEVRQEDLLPRMKWLLNVSKSTPESFYLQLHAEEPPKESLYMLHAAVLVLGDPSIMARWLQKHKFRFPHKNAWVIAFEKEIAAKLTEHAFPHFRGSGPMTATDYSQRIAFQAYALWTRFSKATPKGKDWK
jgi:hypothetical protein